VYGLKLYVAEVWRQQKLITIIKMSYVILWLIAEYGPVKGLFPFNKYFPLGGAVEF